VFFFYFLKIREGFKNLRSLKVLYEANPEMARMESGNPNERNGPGTFFSIEGSVILPLPEYVRKKNMFGYGDRWRFVDIDPFLYKEIRRIHPRRTQPRDLCFGDGTEDGSCIVGLLHVAITESYQHQLDMRKAVKLSTRVKKASRAVLKGAKKFGKKVRDQEILPWKRNRRLEWSDYGDD